MSKESFILGQLFVIYEHDEIRLIWNCPRNIYNVLQLRFAWILQNCVDGLSSRNKNPYRQFTHEMKNDLVYIKKRHSCHHAIRKEHNIDVDTKFKCMRLLQAVEPLNSRILSYVCFHINFIWISMKNVRFLNTWVRFEDVIKQYNHIIRLECQRTF